MSKRLLVVVVGLGVLTVALSCGTPPVVCTSGCAAEARCVPADEASSSTAQCGTGGAVCVACAADQRCVSGACVASVTDAGALDAGALDASVADAGPDDGGKDAGVVDAGADDAGTSDAGTDDAGVPDAGTLDAGAPDAGAPDAGAPDAGAPDAGAVDAGAVDAGPVARVRLMAANLTSGNNQNYDVPPGDVAPGPGIRIMLGAHPDIVMMQEFRVGADNAAALQAMADQILGTGAHVCREPVAVGDIPNGIISRFPIVQCGSWVDTRVSNREFAFARIDVPGPVDLWAISVHLLTANATTRDAEGTALVQLINANIPAGDLFVLGGDLNTDDAMEPVFTTFSSIFAVTPLATDQFGNPGTNTNRLIRLADGGLDPQRNKPYDWVMPSSALMTRMVPISLDDGVTSFTLPHGFVIDTRVFDAGNIGLIAPALLGDSAALNMQHMGVIRDFDLPL